MIFENDELYLKFPTIEDKDLVMDFRREMLESNSNFAGSGKLEDFENYLDWLEKVKNDTSVENLPKDRVPATLFLTIRKSDNKMVGIVQVRHHIEHKYLKVYGGHIGDSIRPSERNKGYATAQIGLALEFCRVLGIKEVLLTADENNISSIKSILKNDGIFDKMVEDKETNKKLNRYFIYL